MTIVNGEFVMDMTKISNNGSFSPLDQNYQKLKHINEESLEALRQTYGPNVGAGPSRLPEGYGLKRRFDHVQQVQVEYKIRDYPNIAQGQALIDNLAILNQLPHQDKNPTGTAVPKDTMKVGRSTAIVSKPNQEFGRVGGQYTGYAPSRGGYENVFVQSGIDQVYVKEPPLYVNNVNLGTSSKVKDLKQEHLL